MGDVRGYPKRSVVIEDQDGEDISVSNPLPIATDSELHDLFYDILVQLKIMNLHLAKMTDEVITEREVD
jgi:hypothetical protein